MTPSGVHSRSVGTPKQVPVRVLDRQSVTNSCNIASDRSEFNAIYVTYLYYTSDSRLYTYCCFFLSVMPPKDL